MVYTLLSLPRAAQRLQGAYNQSRETAISLYLCAASITCPSADCELVEACRLSIRSCATLHSPLQQSAPCNGALHNFALSLPVSTHVLATPCLWRALRNSSYEKYTLLASASPARSRHLRQSSAHCAHRMGCPVAHDFPS